MRYLRHRREVDPMPESHRLIIDRHEGNLAVVEVDGTGFSDLPRWLLPRHAQPGDVLAVTVEPAAECTVISIARDVDATARARSAAERAVERLRLRDPGGDVAL